MSSDENFCQNSCKVNSAVLIGDPFVGCPNAESGPGCLTPQNSQKVNSSGSCFTPSDVQFVAKLNRKSLMAGLMFPESAAAAADAAGHSSGQEPAAATTAASAPAAQTVAKMRIAQSSSPLSEQNRSSGSAAPVRKYRIVPQSPERRMRGWRRPHFVTFTIMIAMAINSHPQRSLPVPAIYKYITKSFPHFRTASTKWRNSIRHNLSQSGVFRKSGSPRTEQKGFCWTFNENKRNWLQKEITSKQIRHLHQMDRQIDPESSVVQDMRAIGMIHPDADF